MLSVARFATTFALMACAVPAFATSFPVTLTDSDGQQVTLSHQPQRVVLQDGRDILALALLDRDDPFQRLVAWNNLLKKSDRPTWELMAKKWPAAQKIVDMGFSDKGDVNLESVVALHPDLMIAQLRAKPSLSQAGVLDKMHQLGIPVLFIDTFKDPVKDTPKSITLLGIALDRESEARAYTDFYQRHYQAILSATRRVTPQPRVFIEAKAGLGGLESCCFTHANVGWGAMVEAVGAKNIATGLLPGATGDISLEKVISLKPDVYIVSGSQWASKNNAAIPFGYNVTQNQVNAAFDKMKQRPGFSQVSAISNNRFYGVYHNFYNHPYNIVGLEYLAKFIYPQQFATLDPANTWKEIVTHFTAVPLGEGVLGAQAPAK